MKHIRSLLLYCVCVSLLAACGGGGGTSGPPAPSIIVTVAPATASVTVGQQIQLTATTTAPALGAVTWATSNPVVATVNSTGLVTALTLGQVNITATIDGQTGSAALTTTTGIVFVSVSAGGNHTCGVTSAGVGYCWGDNSSGQLGNGTTTNSTTPVPVSGGYSFAMISAGETHTCGVTSFSITAYPPVGGTLYCWGNNSSGQLGNGTTTNSATPVPVSVSSTLSFVLVSAGGSHTCAIAPSAANFGIGGVGYCWGENSSGQLGNGTTNNSSVPVAISTNAPVLGWDSLSAGYNHTCGGDNEIAPMGHISLVYCWGDNSLGELGNGTTTNSAVPFFANSGSPFFFPTGAPASAGTGFTCTYSQCWGNNSSGQLGNGTTTNSTVPVTITLSNTPDGYALFSAGGDHTCAVTQYSNGGTPAPPQVGGIAYCWGGNAFGQLGNGTMTNSTTPMVVAGGLYYATISAGGSHTCGVTDTNPPSNLGSSAAVYCWGDNTYGQLGNGTTINSATPVLVNVAG